MPSTNPLDFHAIIRDAVADTIDGLALGVPVVKCDDVDGITKLVDLPAICVCPVGPEVERREFGTNARSGRSYPVACFYMTTGVVNAEKGGDLTVTRFRRELDVAFHLKRLSGVSQVAYCEFSPNPVIWDKDEPAFQRIQSGVVINAIGRFPRS